MSTSTTTNPMRSKTGCHYRIGVLVVSLAATLLASCGGGGGNSAPTGVNTTENPVFKNAYTVTSDNYGLDNPTFLSCGKSNLGIVFRAAIAAGLDDSNYKTVSRIDIGPGAAITPLASYSLGDGGSFPGNIYFLNGHTSTLLRTVGGNISFTRYGSNTGDHISGSYSATVEDDNDPSKPTYTVSASFDLVVDSYGPVLPAPTSPALAAQQTYQTYCASCHALGSYDVGAAAAPDLALKGGLLGEKYAAGQPGHQGVTLTAGQIAAMKVLLNVN